MFSFIIFDEEIIKKKPEEWGEKIWDKTMVSYFSRRWMMAGKKSFFFNAYFEEVFGKERSTQKRWQGGGQENQPEADRPH